MRSRPRDFIYTVDDLFFATTSYLHPEDRIIAFLRYIPDPEGERSRDGRRYSKVDSEGAYRFLKENYPAYLYEAENLGKIILAVPHELIEEILTPTRRLKEIIEGLEGIAPTDYLNHLFLLFLMLLKFWIVPKGLLSKQNLYLNFL